ncbi:MAG: AI-2E family transporter [Clostridia bacterium]|nr:AI-2E family transporter [Clostridia bacterium]
MNNENNKKHDKNNYLKLLCILAVVFVALFALVNFGTFAMIFAIIISVLEPVLIGFIIAYLCNPIYRMFSTKALKKIKRAKLKKVLSIVLTYLVVLAIVAGILLIIIPQFVFAFKDLVAKTDGYINAAIAWANNLISNSNLFAENTDIFDFIDTEKILANLKTFFDASGDILKKVGDLAINYGTNIVGGITNVLLGLFISIYVLIFKEKMAVWFKRIFRAMLSREKYDSFINRIDHVNSKFGNYIIGALTDSIIVAVEGFIIFSLFGIPYAPLVAVIVGITNIIPILGPFLGAVPSAFIIFIVNPEKVILFIILIIVIQQIDGNIVAPFILGSSLGLSSFGIIIAVTVMGSLWGIPGMFIGVPLFAYVADVIEEVVNNKLKSIGDPEFPPHEIQNDVKAPSPIISFIKRKGGNLIKNVRNKTGKRTKIRTGKKK